MVLVKVLLTHPPPRVGWLAGDSEIVSLVVFGLELEFKVITNISCLTGMSKIAEIIKLLLKTFDITDLAL